MSETGWSLDADPPESVTNEPINDRLGLDNENSLISVASSVTSSTTNAPPLHHSTSLNMASNKPVGGGDGVGSSSSGALGITKQNSLNSNDLGIMNHNSSFGSSNLINLNTEQVNKFLICYQVIIMKLYCCSNDYFDSLFLPNRLL
jgi:hypothetical protein